jgi:hypothetical protein
MKRYKVKMPRAALAIAAVAMAVLTLGAAVILPAPNASFGGEPLATANRAVAPAEVAISPGQIEVVSARERRVGMAVFRR